MSVQLILYPQNYQGQFSSFGTPIFTEYVSDYSYNIGTLGTGFSGNFNSNQINRARVKMRYKMKN